MDLAILAKTNDNHSKIKTAFSSGVGIHKASLRQKVGFKIYS
jgi:hypothetical protein